MLHLRTVLFSGALTAILASMLLMIVNLSGIGIHEFLRGFELPFEQVFHLLMYGAMGVWAVMLGARATLILPLAMVLMFVIGASLQIPEAQAPGLHLISMFALGLFVLTVTMIRRGIVGLSMVVCAATAFHHGLSLEHPLSQSGAPMYFLLGAVLAMALVMAMAICAGMLGFSDNGPLYARLRRSPGFGSFL